MSKIMVIDDDKDICKLIVRALEKTGHQVTVRYSAENLHADFFSGYDLLLLDVMMPGLDGFAFCQMIRTKVNLPILFITAKSLEEDLLKGFASGGDDYIKKPFSIMELRARIEAHLRRESREKIQGFSRGEYHFNVASCNLIINIKSESVHLDLTKSEFILCKYLAENIGQVFSLDQLLLAVYGYDVESDINTIRVHIKNIRKKMNLYNKNPIETIWGVGYKWKRVE